MTPAASLSSASSAFGALLVLAVIVPLCGLVPMLLCAPRRVEQVALLLLGLGGLIVGAIAVRVAATGAALDDVIGGWAPPLGMALRADGLSVVMLVMTAVVVVATGLFARTDRAAPTSAMPPAFWMLLMGLWSALNLVFVAQDLFSLYVALELLTFAAVPLVCLDGSRKTLDAALRYLLFALFGSVLYLLATALLYGAYGTLDLPQLAQHVRASGTPEPALVLALALMSVGMAAKAALFPLHLWLPPAHAGAPAAASALLSALVIKAPIYLLVRIWCDLAGPPLAAAGAPLLAIMGAGAVWLCGVMALRQGRLKLLIAYSTAAQIGYLFLMFPLAGIAGAAPWETIAWTGGALQLVSHAFSKAAMFMAAGLIAEALGHDRIADFGGLGRILPVSVFAFGLGGLSLMGLPPSGGFVAKVMLLTAAVQQERWWIAGVILAGGLLAGGYVLRVVVPALFRTGGAVAVAQVSPRRQGVALGLALVAVVLGFVPLQPIGFLAIGRAALIGSAP
ncbi:proton-conducting transporter membrane subunit [Azorhizobium sp. AG788]|uniref:complex I subunit 5 family protein n=1 Tax=Azorhizobium sp. AG788 TaxID=2183897 RepID=UPI003139A103